MINNSAETWKKSARALVLVDLACRDRIAVQAATAFEEARGWNVESVESDTRGFDLISRRPLGDISREPTETRFIEVKGRAGVGEIALTANEYKMRKAWVMNTVICRIQLRIETSINTDSEPGQARVGSVVED
jgi:hypothetical protein